MRQYTITLTLDGANLTADPPVLTMGSQFDNRTHTLLFRRPEALADHEMILQFKGPELAYTPVNRGVYNDFVVPNVLMLATQLTLQISFKRGEELLHANWIRFAIRASGGHGAVALEPWPLPEGPPGLPGKDAHSPAIGGNGNWLAWNDEAGAYEDTGAPSRGAVGPQGPTGLTGPQGPTGPTGPRGERGEKGDRGDQGPRGLPGVDGVAITVNGVEPEGGDVPLTTADIPYRSAPLEAELDRVIPYRDRQVFAGGTTLTLTLEEDAIEAVALAGHTVQEGSGTPSPDNVRPFDGITAPVFTVNGVKHTMAETDPLHGNHIVQDEINSDGIVVRRWGVRELTGNETWAKSPGVNRYATLIPGAMASTTQVMSGHFGSHTDVDGVYTDSISGGRIVIYTAPERGWDTIAAFNQWLADQWQAGTPVRVRYPLNVPILEPCDMIQVRHGAGEVTVAAQQSMTVTTCRLATTRDLMEYVRRDEVEAILGELLDL